MFKHLIIPGVILASQLETNSQKFNYEKTQHPHGHAGIRSRKRDSANDLVN
jgi:hypothetical protein